MARRHADGGVGSSGSGACDAVRACSVADSTPSTGAQPLGGGANRLVAFNTYGDVRGQRSPTKRRHYMPPRRTQSAQRAPTSGPYSLSGATPSKHVNPKIAREHTATTKRWRRDVRPKDVRKAVAATRSLPWSSTLIEVLLEELYVADTFEELLDTTASDLPRRQYPQAIAVALIVRHSWRADDLAWILERLGLTDRAVRRPSSSWPEDRAGPRGRSAPCACPSATRPAP